MNSKTVLLIILLMTAIFNTQAQEKDKILNELITEAIRVSPKIKMLKAKHSATASRIEQGTNLPDPMLMLGIMNLPMNSFSFSQEPMTGKTIGISQEIPFPSGLRAAADVKAIDTIIVRQEIKDLQNEIRKNISTFFYDLHFVRGEILLNNENQELLKQILAVVKSSYEVSNGSMQNIINVEVELTRLKDYKEILIGKENALVAELNVILIRDEKAPIYLGNVSPIEINLITSQEVLNIALENQPNLKGIKLSEQKSNLMEREAEYEFYPNFNLGIQYTQRDKSILTGMTNSDLVSFTAGISLPINYGGKKTAKVNEAKYMQSMYRETYNASIQELKRAINIITVKISELQKRNKLISETLLPQVEQAIKVALSDYQVGKIDFVNVINSEKEILNVKTDLLKIQTDYTQNIVMLEYLVGAKLPQGNNVKGDLK